MQIATTVPAAEELVDQYRARAVHPIDEGLLAIVKRIAAMECRGGHCQIGRYGMCDTCEARAAIKAGPPA